MIRDRVNKQQSRAVNLRELHMTSGYAVAQLVEALRYTSAGRGFDSRGINGIFHWHNPSGRTMTMGLTQPLTEMITRNIS
jgi:hypothetical protein